MKTNNNKPSNNTSMKKMILCIAMVLISTIAMGQAKPTKVAENQNTPKIEKVDAKTFRAVKSSSRGGDYKPTGYYYEVKGERYEIYLHTISRGDNAGKVACYIKRVSKKSGKEYWQKIDIKPEDLK